MVTIPWLHKRAHHFIVVDLAVFRMNTTLCLNVIIIQLSFMSWFIMILIDPKTAVSVLSSFSHSFHLTSKAVVFEELIKLVVYCSFWKISIWKVPLLTFLLSSVHVPYERFTLGKVYHATVAACFCVFRVYLVVIVLMVFLYCYRILIPKTVCISDLLYWNFYSKACPYSTC